MTTQYSIGEFSTAAGLSPKTLRFYHEKGLLIPAAIDRATGYRIYDDRCLDKARIIVALRRLDFSLEEIAQMLTAGDDDRDILDYLEVHKRRIADEMARHRKILVLIDQIVAAERLSRRLVDESPHAVVEKPLDAQLVGGIRVSGRYRDCGPTFGTLGKRLGRHIAGKPMCLYYDGEFRDEDADFEPCFPIRKAVEIDGVSVHELPARHCVSLVHVGPYEELGRSYARIIEHAKQKDLKIALPTREVYLKGPGLIFKGRPKNYVTEIQIPID